jgi:hypothetical protein
VDENEVGQVKIQKTIGARFSLDGTFDVGEDTGTPVLEDYAVKMRFKFSANSGNSWWSYSRRSSVKRNRSDCTRN